MKTLLIRGLATAGARVGAEDGHQHRQGQEHRAVRQAGRHVSYLGIECVLDGAG